MVGDGGYAATVNVMNNARLNSGVSYDDALRTALKLGVSEDLAIAGIDNIISGNTALVAFSGKIASGKDTVAPLVMQELTTVSNQDAFAGAAKKELDVIFSVVKSENRSRVKTVQELMGVSLEEATTAVDLASKALMLDPDARGAGRTKEIRTLNIFWGNAVRRGQDPQYWIKKAIQSSFQSLANNVSVFVTDTRYINEAQALLALGAPLIRIDVSPKVQRQRLMGRDGLEPDPAVVNSVTEVQLDDFSDFFYRANNDGPLQDTVRNILKELKH